MANRRVFLGEEMEDSESHSLRGAVDAGALYDFLTEFERLEPLASGSLDDPVSPGELRLGLADGIGEASSASLTIRWSVQDDYNAHYSDDEGRNLRWDVHRHEYTTPTGDAHYHPPPDAASDDAAVAESCVEVIDHALVARAIHQLWRAAYEAGDVEPLNDAINPP